MLTLILRGDTYAFPADSGVRHIAWNVNTDVPLAALPNLRTLQQILPQPISLMEVSLFHVQQTDCDCAVSGLSNHTDGVWVPLDPALSPAELGLQSESLIYLSSDPFNIFSTRRVLLPVAPLTCEGSWNNKSRDKDGMVETPHWIPLLHGLLRWKLCSAPAKDITLCGTSGQQAVKVGENGWANGLVKLSLSLGELFLLQDVNGTSSGGALPRTVSWSVCLNAIRKRDAQRVAALHAHHQTCKGEKADTKDGYAGDAKTRQFREVSLCVMCALCDRLQPHSGVNDTNGTNPFPTVASLCKRATAAGAADNTVKTSLSVDSFTAASESNEKSRQEADSMVVDDYIALSEGGERQKEREDAPTATDADVQAGICGKQTDCVEAEEDGDTEDAAISVPGAGAVGVDAHSAEEDEIDVRVPPSVLIGLASPEAIDQYIDAAKDASAAAAATTTGTASDGTGSVGELRSPLRGYFLEPYTGSFFVDGALSCMVPLRCLRAAPPSLGATVTLTVELDARLLNVVVDGEVVLAFSLSSITPEEAFSLRPVVQLFSCGAVVDIH
ncbi:hypothetical protein DQ04_02571050 [Trypanosoma grayi]|uniref:hypothetical protein n=1 Tax=Trypanosoma grayi TaxID=71804 RepID=UPI0004F47B17|nr:hypothetical protein DQ04_02571050 [Trypanosoma grayi]KEG11487.1 hypothetical protein DQ04_02571050 [Trypanosoma grayi]